jgi:hypothetical protein
MYMEFVFKYAVFPLTKVIEEKTESLVFENDLSVFICLLYVQF